MAAINVRSPYYRTVLAATTIDYYEMDLYIYSGTQTTDRATGVYYAIVGKCVPDLINTSNVRMAIDISPYVRDYIDSIYTGDYTDSTTDAVWVDWRTRSISTSGTPSAWSAYSDAYALDGYGYFEEEDQWVSDTNASVLISPGTTLYIPDGELLTIPIEVNNWDTDYDPFFSLPGVGTDTVSFTPPKTESTELIYYWTEDGLQDYDRINQDQNLDPDITLNYIERVTEYKHTPIKIVFKNKYGVLQEMWFFGKTTLNGTTTKESFNRDTYIGGTVDVSQHRKVNFNKKGKETITLNSGWQVEANNELFRQLMLSEQVWMHYRDMPINSPQAQPVNVIDSSIQYKTSINDKLINYTINFEFAYDQII